MDARGGESTYHKHFQGMHMGSKFRLFSSRKDKTAGARSHAGPQGEAPHRGGGERGFVLRTGGGM